MKEKKNAMNEIYIWKKRTNSALYYYSNLEFRYTGKDGREREKEISNFCFSNMRKPAFFDQIDEKKKKKEKKQDSNKRRETRK